MPHFTRIKNLTPWRKLALVTWKSPGDPSVYGQFDFDTTAALAYLEKINKTSQIKITLTHYFAKAMAITLSRYPTLNALIKWGKIYQRDNIDIFLQVAIADESDDKKESLSGHKICGIDKKSLTEIALELTDGAGKIRAEQDPQFQKTFNIAKILPVWLLKLLIPIQGFLVYNLGLHMPGLGLVADPFGSAMLTSVGSLGTPPGFAPLVPPSRCPFLMCLGRVENRPWVVGDQIAIRPIANFTATFDHRLMDGLMGSRMFKMFMDVLAHPERYF
jgi:pyruvate dehydrogenase E2 component (dihydrolipoamide acetyltransferase)